MCSLNTFLKTNHSRDKSVETIDCLFLSSPALALRRFSAAGTSVPPLPVWQHHPSADSSFDLWHWPRFGHPNTASFSPHPEEAADQGGRVPAPHVTPGQRHQGKDKPKGVSISQWTKTNQVQSSRNRKLAVEKTQFRPDYQEMYTSLIEPQRIKLCLTVCPFVVFRSRSLETFTWERKPRVCTSTVNSHSSLVINYLMSLFFFKKKNLSSNFLHPELLMFEVV